jgi:hypothetical protein
MLSAVENGEEATQIGIALQAGQPGLGFLQAVREILELIQVGIQEGVSLEELPTAREVDLPEEIRLGPKMRPQPTLRVGRQIRGSASDDDDDVVGIVGKETLVAFVLDSPREIGGEHVHRVRVDAQPLGGQVDGASGGGGGEKHDEGRNAADHLRP